SSCVAREEREHRRVDTVVAMAQVFPLDAFALEAEALEHSLRGGVAAGHVRFDAATAIRQGVLGHLLHRPGRDASTASREEEPVADLDDVAQRIEMMQGGASEQLAATQVLDDVRGQQPLSAHAGKLL